MNIQCGEFVAIMGPSGSGKSTLINLLGLLDRPTHGCYLFEGRDMSRLHHDDRAMYRSRKIGFVFQNFSLLGRNTALENVELPLIYAGIPKGERLKRATVALDKVGLGERKGHWPAQLSGGEQQRVAIARALANDPVLILADEPTGALDSATGLEILASLQSLNEHGRTVIVVTHDPIVARHAKRIITMRDGRAIRDELAQDLEPDGQRSLTRGSDA
jgi:putative ABC transport system ATP-binding protein